MNIDDSIKKSIVPQKEMHKCKICGKEITEEKVLKSLFKYDQQGCDECSLFLELNKVTIDHWRKFKNDEADNPVEQKNYKTIKREDETSCEIKELGDYDTEYKVTGRTEFVKSIIKEIELARKLLYIKIQPMFEILESIYDKKNVFWNDGGDLWYYVRDSIVSYIVIHLKEYLDASKHNKSKLSIYRFQNILRNHKKEIFENQRITCERKFGETGDTMQTAFDVFPILEYFEKMQNVLNDYSLIISSISDYRDNVFAHVSELRNKGLHEPQLNLINVRKIFNSLKIIYNGLLYSVAPEKYTNIIFHHNLFLDHLNTISKYYEEHVVKPKQKTNALKQK